MRPQIIRHACASGPVTVRAIRTAAPTTMSMTNRFVAPMAWCTKITVNSIVPPAFWIGRLHFSVWKNAPPKSKRQPSRCPSTTVDHTMEMRRAVMRANHWTQLLWPAMRTIVERKTMSNAMSFEANRPTTNGWAINARRKNTKLWRTICCCSIMHDSWHATIITAKTSWFRLCSHITIKIITAIWMRKNWMRCRRTNNWTNWATAAFWETCWTMMISIKISVSASMNSIRHSISCIVSGGPQPLHLSIFTLFRIFLLGVSVVSLDKALETNHLSARVGDNVEIKCDVTGSPAPPIIWSRNGVDLSTLNEEDVCDSTRPRLLYYLKKRRKKQIKSKATYFVFILFAAYRFEYSAMAAYT